MSSNKLNPTSVLAKPDIRQLKALARLIDHQDFATFYEYLESCLAEQDKKNRVAKDDTSLRQGQGVSQALESIISQCLSAKDDLRRSNHV